MQSLKLCCLGDGGVGKTAITIQLCHHHFVEEYDPTIEDSYRKQCVIDGNSYALEILDTAGQEEFKSLRDQWIRSCEGYVLVYSITSRLSFDQLPPFKQLISRVKEEENPHILILGNKSDLIKYREVATSEGEALAKQVGALFMEASAKTRTNIEEGFYALVRTISQEKGWKNTKMEDNKKKNSKRQKKCSLF